MRKKLTYVLLVSLLVAGSSAFAMMGEEGVPRDIKISRSTALRLLNTGETLEVGGHHFKVNGFMEDTGKEAFLAAPADEIISFYNSAPKGQPDPQWFYSIDLSNAVFGHPADPYNPWNIDMLTHLYITQVD